MIDLSDFGLKFIGFWDNCFFNQNTKYSGIIAKDEQDNIKYISWFEFNKMTRGLSK